MTFALVTYYAEAFALLLLPKSSEAQPRQTRERNTCLRYNLFLMYDEPRSVPVPYVRRPLSIGPGLCELPRTLLWRSSQSKASASFGE